MKKFIIFIIVLFAFTLVIHAEGEKEELFSNIESELEDFKNSLPEKVIDFFPDEIFKGDFSSLTDGSINEKTFLNVIFDYLTSNISNILKTFFSLLCIIIISSIIHIMEKSFKSEPLKNVFSICSTICVAITVFNVCSILAKQATTYIQICCNLMNAFTPVMAIMYMLSGNITSASVSTTSVLLFISLIENFLLVWLLPIVKICLCFSIIKSIHGSFDLSGISKILKNTFTGVIVFTMSIFSFVMSYKNILSQSADSLSIRTAKFAISNFIPIVGSSVNEALRTVVSSLSFIKNSCGVVAIIAILLIVLPQIISLLLYKLCFGVSSAIADMIGCEHESKSIAEANSICGFILAMVCCTSIMFIFSLTIFIKTSVVV